MKREPKSPAADADAASADWRSGAAGVLDSYDDVMWDELRDLSPPHSLRSQLAAPFESRVTPIDAISEASPVKSSSTQVEYS
ncbi:unnamed protein product [Phytophthora lilii]|uniref:Unnamed protein product n=1 Tax=Phytophthora lilii TaxID=2077276 RepID=A0A9W6U5X2_9STRA|nr:unnamed protein product [Phytophthora lilii]GMF31409.1 unnamed protein product [Phytophthora lilii]